MTGTFSALNRDSVLALMNETHYDLLVIGGGITGAGIALDAVTRGLKVALVEMQDFAAGTSSRSTKLVHGGLRYLKQFEIREVAELGKERAIVYENGPHVTTPEWMLLPFHKGGTFGKWSTSLGLRMYDFLAGVKKSERRTMLSPEETIAKEPLVKKEDLMGGGYYVEYRTDDARLTIEVIKAAVSHGADIVNYVKVEDFLYKNKQLIGVKVQDMLTNEERNIYAKKVVNATGPWVDKVRKKDAANDTKQLRLTKGVHLVIDQSVFPLQQAVYFDTPDGRMVFAIPRDGKTYVGTTDTFYEEDPTNPRTDVKDRDYIIQAIHYMFPEVQVNAEDIESSYAGVRPLIYEEGKDASEISRKDEIWRAESGLITIAGGKLTGYRKMAETVVDLVCQELTHIDSNLSVKSCQTRQLPISGGDVGGADQFPSFIAKKTKQAVEMGLPEKEMYEIVKRYGSNIDTILNYVSNEWAEKEQELPKLLYAKLHYAIHHEMAVTPVDFFLRRTGALLFNIELVERWKIPVVNKMAQILNWSPDQLSAYKDELEKEIRAAQLL